MEEKENSLMRDFWSDANMGAIVRDPFRVQSEYKPIESVRYSGGTYSSKHVSSSSRKVSSRSSALNAAMFNSIF